MAWNKSGARKESRPFSFWLFILFWAFQTIVPFGVLAVFFPDFWTAQWSASVAVLIVTFVLAHFVNCFFEYFFHRDVLHAPIIPFLKHFYKEHSTHHALTRVVCSLPNGAPCPAKNVYPIIEKKQNQAAFFPYYSLTLFFIVFTPFLLGMQKILPRMPIFVCGYAAVSFSYALYEIAHAIEHLPPDWWARKLERPFWRTVYGFHLLHHADIKCNEGISGFFLVPVADFIFGTFRLPKKLPLPGQVLSVEDLRPLRPFWLIRFLDKLADRSLRLHGKKS